MRVEDREEGKAVGVPYSRLAPEAVKQNRWDTPDVGKEMARPELDRLAASRSTMFYRPTPLLLSPAFAKRRTSTNKLERATGAEVLFPPARSSRGSSLLLYKSGWNAGARSA
jgi:hypothetical protein